MTMRKPTIATMRKQIIALTKQIARDRDPVAIAVLAARRALGEAKVLN